MEHIRKHLTYCYAPRFGKLSLNNIPFHFQQSTLILLSITAILGNSLILAALHKESSLHPPSKLLYRFLATSDLLVGLVSQPLVMLSFLVDADGHKCGPTSRHAVGTELQRDCNFKAHVYHYSYLLGFISSRGSILSSQLPYNLLVHPYSRTIMPSYLNFLVHKDFPRSQSSSGSSTRSCSTTAYPTECTEHGAIQKGSVQCTVGAVSVSCLLCTILYRGNCDLS